MAPKITKPRADWLTPNIKLLIKDKERELQKVKVTKSNADWFAFKQLRNQTFSLIIRKKKRKIILTILVHKTNLGKL